MDRSRWKKNVLQIASDLHVLDLVQRLRLPYDQNLYVLTYHRVEELERNPYLDPSEISATPSQFLEQMRLISSRYNPVSADDVLNAYHGGKKIPPDSVLVTVDDGYCDFSDVIFPICQQFDIKPMLFVTTSFIGHGIFWWDKVFQIIQFSEIDYLETPFGLLAMRNALEKRATHKKILHGLKQMPSHEAVAWVDEAHGSLIHASQNDPVYTLNWDSLRRLKQNGCAIASHSHTHPILSRCSLDEVREQVRLSREMIQTELGECIPIFALPDGKAHAYNQDILNILHQESMDIIFHLEDGRMQLIPNSPVAAPRIAVWQSLTLPHFHLRLTPLIDKKGNKNIRLPIINA